MSESSSGSTALVTGGAGFLGSHLCDRLLAQGKRVICLDNLSTGRLANIAHLMQGDQFELIVHDVCEPLPDLAVQEIWNFACPASPPRYKADPVHTLLTSVLGVRNCLELARYTGARLFHASTSEVYGDPQVHPQPEAYLGSVNPIGPRACYDEGKRAAEALLFDFARLHGVAIKVVRIFNTYGPRMDPEDGRVISNFVVRALRNQPLEIYGDGRQTRSFCYVDDLVDGLTRLMVTGQDITGPINIGNPGEFSVAELAKMVLEITGSGSSVVFTEATADDPRQRRPDIVLAETLLGWCPTIALRDGLERTIDYFRGQLSPTPLAKVVV